jgi:hypothetical protein
MHQTRAVKALPGGRGFLDTSGKFVPWRHLRATETISSSLGVHDLLCLTSMLT